jgi:hypothetical protein
MSCEGKTEFMIGEMCYVQLFSYHDVDEMDLMDEMDRRKSEESFAGPGRLKLQPNDKALL